jgi:septal ring factor EnvC (AmiA/AmiB activator)
MKSRWIALALSLVASVASAQTDVAPPTPQPSGLGMATSEAISDMEVQLARLDKDMTDARRELEGVAPAKAAAETRIRARGRMLYRLLRAGLMPLGGGFASFVDHAQRVERLKRALAKDLADDAWLGKRGAELAGSLDAWTKERAALADKKNLAVAAKSALDEEKRRHEAFESAFATSWQGPTKPPSDEIVVYGPSGKSAPESLDPGSFRARKGRLTFPVAGQAEVKAAMRDGGPGLEIKASLGAVVRAVHPGRVAFADRYGTYGQIVILDHGDRCYTISANLGTMDVKVGDEVSAGERIGTIGDDGRGPSLYFEIRIGNERVAPQPWLGL